MARKSSRLAAAYGLLLVVVAPVAGQQRVRVFVGEIKGPDTFISERFKFLFMEELSKVKSVDVVTRKDQADLVLEGIGRLDTLQQSAVSGAASQTGAVVSGRAGDNPNALLSVTLSDQKTEKVLFVGNKSKTSGGWGGKGATQEAVVELVKDMKKTLKWK